MCVFSPPGMSQGGPAFRTQPAPVSGPADTTGPPATPPLRVLTAPNAPQFGPLPQGQVPKPPTGPAALQGPNNGTILDRYRQAGADYGGGSSNFTGIDHNTGYQYVNGHLFDPEGMTQSGDKSVMGKGFSDFLTHYGITPDQGKAMTPAAQPAVQGSAPIAPRLAGGFNPALFNGNTNLNGKVLQVQPPPQQAPSMPPAQMPMQQGGSQILPGSTPATGTQPVDMSGAQSAMPTANGGFNPALFNATKSFQQPYGGQYVGQYGGLSGVINALMRRRSY